MIQKAAGVSEQVGAAERPGIEDWLGMSRKRMRDPLQWISALVIGVPLLLLANALRNNPAFEFPVVAQYLFDPSIVMGAFVTVSLAAACLLTGAALGLIVVAMRLSQNPLLSWFAKIYTWVLRSVPPLVVILLWYNFGALYPRLTLRIPFVHWTLLDVASSNVIGSYASALIALTLVQGAYQAEIFRGGLSAAAFGQKDAALALGMSHFEVMKHVIFPQVLPLILPPTGNQFIHLVKSTSIVSFIALGDILFSVETISSDTGKIIPLLVVAICWYVAILGLASIAQARLEKIRWR